MQIINHLNFNDSKKNYSKVMEVIVSLLVALFVNLLFLMPMWRTGRILWRVDEWFHLNRIHELSNAIETHTWPNLIAFQSFGGSGQLIPGMYPFWTLYPFVWVSHFFGGLVNQYYVMLLLFGVVSYISIYFALRVLLVDVYNSNLGSVIYSLAFIVNPIVQYGVFGNSLALIFVPWLLVGYIKISNNEKYGIRLLSLSVGAILLTHIMTGLVAVITIIVLAITNLFLGYARSFRDFLTAGMVSMFISMITIISVLFIGKETLKTATVKMLPFDGTQFVKALFNGGTEYLGITFFSAVALIFLIVNINNLNKLQKNILIVSLVTILVTTAILPWYYLQKTPISIIQFPKRLFSVVVIFVFMLAIVFISKLDRNINLITLVIVFIGLTSIFNSATLERNSLMTLPVWNSKVNGYDIGTTVLTEETLNNSKFYSIRTYRDYLPNKMLPFTQLSIDRQSAQTAEMADVNVDHSVRLLNQQVPVTKESFWRQTGSKINPGKIRAVGNKEVITFHVPDQGKYELPFWYYGNMSYVAVLDDRKITKLTGSKRGRLVMTLTPGNHQLVITQKYPKAYKVALWFTMGTIFIVIGSFIIRPNILRTSNFIENLK